MGIVNLSLGREQIILFKPHPHLYHPTYDQIHYFYFKFAVEWNLNEDQMLVPVTFTILVEMLKSYQFY